MSGDRPNSLELVEAVAAWMVGELSPRLDKATRFQVLVAAHGLGIAARELRTAAEHEAADVEELGGLLPEGAVPRDAAEVRRALAAALRTGRLDDRLSEVAGPIRAHVRRKLSVARPGYEDG